MSELLLQWLGLITPPLLLLLLVACRFAYWVASERVQELVSSIFIVEDFSARHRGPSMLRFVLNLRMKCVKIEFICVKYVDIQSVDFRWSFVESSDWCLQ